jgi:hypothetical protein
MSLYYASLNRSKTKPVARRRLVSEWVSRCNSNFMEPPTNQIPGGGPEYSRVQAFFRDGNKFMALAVLDVVV